MKYNSPIYHEAYKNCRNQVNKLIKEVKAKYFESNLENCKNSKESWKFLNELLNKHSKVTTVKEIVVNGEAVTDDKKFANEFNKYFSTIGPKLAGDILSNDHYHRQYMTPESRGTNVFQFHNVTNTKIRKEIKKAKATKSSGVDKISINLLQAAGDSIIDPFTHIFSLSLNTGTFTGDLKYAKIIPIHKSGDKPNCGNYRPVSVIPAVPKIFEKIVYLQLYQFLSNNEILSIYQLGFRPQHSTETALLHSTIKWLSNMDEDLINGILFLDLKKSG